MNKQVLTLSTGSASQPVSAALQRRARYSSGAALRILQRLQVSLDPVDILRRYAEELKDMLGVAGLRWQPTVGPAVEQGRLARYRLVYSLNLADAALGELTITRRGSFSEEESRLVEQTLGLLIHPLRNAVSYKQALDAARLDALTGVGNRKAFDEAVTRELELSRRHGEPLAVILIDIDHFKQINDGYGHLAGDAVLRSVAEALGRSARQSDLVFRYAGDEFVIVMSRTGADGARAVAERVREAIGALRVCQGGELIPVRASLGLTVADAGEDAQALFHRVDLALLSAKRNGRDQVAVAG